MVNQLNLVSCDWQGEMKLYYGEHILFTNVKRIFKWRSDSINKSSELRKDIEDQLYALKKNIDRGVRRVKV